MRSDGITSHSHPSMPSSHNLFPPKKRKCVADMFLNRNFASIHLLGLEITVLIKSLVLIKITSIVSCIYRHLKILIIPNLLNTEVVV